MPEVGASEDSSYKIREDEQHIFHIELINREFNEGTKEVDEIINVQKFSKEEWKRYEKTAVIRSYDRQRIIHNPNKIKKVAVSPDPVEGLDIEAIREEYEAVTGNKAGNRKAETLLKEIQEAQ